MQQSLGDSLVDQVCLGPLGQAGGGQPVLPTPRSPSRGVVQKINYSHDGMIDLILVNPGITQNEIAARLGYSVGWVSQVCCSDAFQARLAERSKEVVDPVLRASIEDQFKGLVARSLDILRVKLERQPGDIPDNLALRTLELSSRALGYGARPPATPGEIDAVAHLARAADNLTVLLAKKKAEVEPVTVEGEFSPVASSTG